MRTECTAEVFSKSSGESVSSTLTYSIETYARNIVDYPSSGDNLVELIYDMMKYGDSAVAFFAK